MKQLNGQPEAEAPVRLRSAVHVAEAALAFCLGFAVMQFIYSATPDPASNLPMNVPGNDSWYHIKMAALLPVIGLPDQFPWLQHTIFADRFVSHHYGFHVYLCPFVLISHALTGSYLPGARWAMAVSFGLVFAACALLCIQERVRARWLLLALLLLLPTDFYSRHSYVRAIDLSLLCILVGTLLMFRRRYLGVGIMVFVFTQIYLASFFLVIVAVIHFFSLMLEEGRGREAWQLCLWTAVGFVLGLVIHPYFPDNIPFLWTQIFQSGLTPEIGVGQEWNPYEDVWKFACGVGVPLWAFAIALAVRLRTGPRLSTNQWTMLVASIFFFALMLKARRFVEYWPVFAVLATMMIARPALARWSVLLEGAERGVGGATVATVIWVMAAAVTIGTAGWLMFAWREKLMPLLAWWPGWLLLVVAGVAVYLPDVSAGGGGAGGAQAAPGQPEPRGRFSLLALTRTAVTALAVACVLTVSSGFVLITVRNWGRGKYNLHEVEAAMTALREASAPGDLVFTDDWDIFPVFFFFNHHNHYSVGLDPVFAYRHDAELWERYVRISRGQAPCRATAQIPTEDGFMDKSIDVKLEDLRDKFGARFVTADRDHRPLAQDMERAAGLAERVFPVGEIDEKRWPPWVVYRILEPGEAEQAGK